MSSCRQLARHQILARRLRPLQRNTALPHIEGRFDGRQKFWALVQMGFASRHSVVKTANTSTLVGVERSVHNFSDFRQRPCPLIFRRQDCQFAGQSPPWHVEVHRPVSAVFLNHITDQNSADLTRTFLRLIMSASTVIEICRFTIRVLPSARTNPTVSV